MSWSDLLHKNQFSYKTGKGCNNYIMYEAQGEDCVTIQTEQLPEMINQIIFSYMQWSFITPPN